MPPKNITEQGMAVLREVAQDATTAVQKVTSAKSGEMGTAEAFAPVRAGLQNIRREFERLYELTHDDSAEDRERRLSTIQAELIRLDECEVNLDAAEKRLLAANARAND
jgi:hypothetical protein